MNQPQTNSPFLRACRGEPVPYTPVWFMRQAGRSLPEYHRVRAGIAMLESCTRPELVTEITLQPLRRYDVDAADPVQRHRGAAAGDRRGRGDQAGRRPGDRPARSAPWPTSTGCATLEPGRRAVHHRVGQGADRRARRQAADRVRGRPLHAGVVPDRGRPVQEPRPDQGPDVRQPRALARADGAGWPPSPPRSCRCRSRRGRRRCSCSTPGSAWSARGLPARDPAAHPADLRRPGAVRACRGSTSASAPASCSACSARRARTWSAWTGGSRSTRAPAGSAPGKAIQGNLDPSVLLAPWDVIEPRARAILDRGRTLPGHVFNLGHGVLPETDPDMLARLVDLVHEASATRA